MDEYTRQRLDRVEERLNLQDTTLRETMNTRIGSLEKRFISLNDFLVASVMHFYVIVLVALASLAIGVALSR
jgi:hypothetical protein